LVQLAAGLPDKHNTRVMVMSGDAVPYAHLIGAMDAVLASCEGESARCLHKISVGDATMFRTR